MTSREDDKFFSPLLNDREENKFSKLTEKKLEIFKKLPEEMNNKIIVFDELEKTSNDEVLKNLLDKFSEPASRLNRPSIIFSGSAGVGKTAMMEALRKQIFGKEPEPEPDPVPPPPSQSELAARRRQQGIAVATAFRQGAQGKVTAPRVAHFRRGWKP